MCKNMPKFVIFSNFTEKGKANIKELEKRMAQTYQLTTALGGKSMKDEDGNSLVFFTMGRYDIVILAEFPNEEVMMKWLLMAGAGGISDTETMIAIQANKAIELIKEMP